MYWFLLFLSTINKVGRVFVHLPENIQTFFLLNNSSYNHYFVTNSSFPKNHTLTASQSSHQCDSELHSNNSLWTKPEFDYVLFPVHNYFWCFITFKPMKSEITKQCSPHSARHLLKFSFSGLYLTNIINIRHYMYSPVLWEHRSRLLHSMCVPVLHHFYLSHHSRFHCQEQRYSVGVKNELNKANYCMCSARVDRTIILT